MKTSGAINELAAALAKAQGEFQPIPKNKEVDFIDNKGRRVHYRYADLADILSVVSPVLSKNGLSHTQEIGFDFESKILYLTTTIMHSSGQYRSSVYPLKEFNNPQEQGSSITYTRKYSITAALGIHGDEDDDGELGSNQSQKPAQKPKEAPRAHSNNPAPVPNPNGPKIKPKEASVPDTITPPKAQEPTIKDNLAAIDQPPMATVKEHEKILSLTGKNGWSANNIQSYMGMTFDGRTKVSLLTVKEANSLAACMMAYQAHEMLGDAPTESEPELPLGDTPQ